ncbi:hypothetical protein NE237_016830 [Protea cynaroides]|uniref:RVP_2 domain-containing protein n=1 Tax=Protea cynaroides TaxID=273540 RepID=A0A9Q0K6I4_9MAGN|nr:hypothetical protein NE237_016830 [Protea cynaroides]
MRVKGGLQNKLDTVLIDSGSTHNFMSQTLANRVMVASGEKLISPGKCNQTQLILQGIPIFVDFYLLPLEGYDVVLGTEWLSTLGPIVWDFSKLQMSFHVEGKEVALHGLSIPENKVVSNLQLQRSARKKKRDFCYNYFLCGPPKFHQLDLNFLLMC